MIERLDHVAVLTGDLDAAVAFFAELLGNQPPRVVSVDRPGVRFRTAMIPVGVASGTYLQLFEPGEGPGVEELARGGEGAIFECAFKVSDLVEFRRSRPDIEALDVAGRPIDEDYLVAASGRRYVYLPAARMRGTRIEIIEDVDAQAARQEAQAARQEAQAARQAATRADDLRGEEPGG